MSMRRDILRAIEAGNKKLREIESYVGWENGLWIARELCRMREDGLVVSSEGNWETSDWSAVKKKVAMPTEPVGTPMTECYECPTLTISNRYIEGWVDRCEECFKARRDPYVLLHVLFKPCPKLEEGLHEGACDDDSHHYGLNVHVDAITGEYEKLMCEAESLATRIARDQARLVELDGEIEKVSPI